MELPCHCTAYKLYCFSGLYDDLSIFIVHRLLSHKVVAYFMRIWSEKNKQDILL